MTMKRKPSVKDYSKQVRVFDNDGYRRRVDCICFSDSKKEVLMVSSLNEISEWGIPGGGLEPNEQPLQTAHRELLEEAGVRGELLNYVGVFDNDERRTRTQVYTMMVTEETEHWLEKQEVGRQRKWFPVDEAIAMLLRRKPLKAEYLQAACDQLHRTCDQCDRPPPIRCRQASNLSSPAGPEHSSPELGVIVAAEHS